ncbi:Ppx/GppA phosphatase family protein [Allorhizobium undicola]|uniref:Ppx/GppA phosphatase family protein n=1 Tax=Allorhizobium undicola TaxID=78527 RepID=UPI000688F80B|nr:Ppx/GppA phosphatase family protein [Allorhizobium undicola]
MVDPGSGEHSPVSGASKEGRAEQKGSRRGRGKRKGHKSPLQASPVSEQRGVQPPVERRLVSDEQQAPQRKRKRRRKNRGQASGDVQAVKSVAQDVVTSGAGAVGAPAANPHKGGKRRRRGQGKQSAQVRPLAPGRAVDAAREPGHASSHLRQAAGKGGGLRHGQAKASAQNGSLVRGGQGRQARAEDVAHGDKGRHAFEVSHRAQRFSGEQGDDYYAALDLGTNNCRLLIAQPTRPGQFRVVDAFSRIVRLGEGLGASGRLSQDAMDRAVEALKVCASKLSGLNIRRKRLIATEACRAAENGEAFLARVRQETGLELEIINRETEARLAVSGCASLVGRETRSIVLFDIGGGSSEIAVIRIDDNRSARLANHITHWTSLPVGVVTLSERHGGRDVTPDVFEAMTAEVAAMLSAFDCPPIASAAGEDDFHLIGTSGTVTTLAGVHLDLPRYDRRRVDGLWLTDAEVSAMQAKLLSWDYQSRAANPCIGPDRADLVLAGCAILEAIRRRWPSSRMRVADRGLREGLLTDMMADDGVWRRNRQRRQMQKDHRDHKDRGGKDHDPRRS